GFGRPQPDHLLAKAPPYQNPPPHAPNRDPRFVEHSGSGRSFLRAQLGPTLLRSSLPRHRRRAGRWPNNGATEAPASWPGGNAPRVPYPSAPRAGWHLVTVTLSPRPL